MPQPRWIERRLTTTRGRILTLLRRGPQTVPELAAAIGLTDNAVRAQLAALEGDNLVEVAGVRREGVGKPAHLYSLTADAEEFFPRAYGRLLVRLLDAITDQLGEAAARQLLLAAGRELVRRRPAETASIRQRAEAAVTALGELGGAGEIRERDGHLHIRGHSCPIAAVVRHHPEACALVEALLAEILGVPVREVCEKGEPPRCGFEIEAATG